MKAIIAITSSIVISLFLLGNYIYDTNDLKTEFNDFKKQYNKSYGTVTEENYRFKIFSENYVYSEKTNKNGSNTYTLGTNKFFDLSFNEFNNIYLMKSELSSFGDQKNNNNENLSEEFDWTKEDNIVSDVKNQGQCGSCWAFGSTGALESYLRKNENRNDILSEQELVDCSTQNSGCNGGLGMRALGYINKNGLSSEDKYSYKAVNQRCKRNIPRTIEKGQFDYKQAFNSYKSYDELRQKLQEGPIAVSIEVRRDFQLYKKGIYQPDSYCGMRTNHAVLLVGYGKNNNSNYTKIKNSWGKTWGEDGYIKISFENNKIDSCGITCRKSYQVVKN